LQRIGKASFITTWKSKTANQPERYFTKSSPMIIVSSMINDNNEPKKRLGPVGFHAESKVTNSRQLPGPNLGGIGEASGPTLETPRKSKELKVAGLKFWIISGVFLLVLGIVTIWPLLIGVGSMFLIFAIFTNRRNKIESRVRKI
jgi:hypothetical protein